MLFATFPFVFTHIFDVSIKAETDIDQDVTNFFNIPMHSILEPDELDNYLSQAVKRAGTPLHGGGTTGKYSHLCYGI
jgi:hypothetical protein